MTDRSGHRQSQGIAQAAYAAEDQLKGLLCGRGYCDEEERTHFPAATRILPLGRGNPAARLHRCRGLQAVHLPAAVLQAPVRVYDEELQKALAESGGDQDYAALPENHRFQIPADAHWQATSHQGQERGQGHPGRPCGPSRRPTRDTLYGIFGDAQWTNKDRLPDHMLRELIEHFATLTLSLAKCPEDELGRATST